MKEFIVKPNKTVAELKAIANESNKISIIDLINSEYKNIYAPIGPERYAKAESVSEPEPDIEPSIFEKIKSFLFYPVL